MLNLACVQALPLRRKKMRIISEIFGEGPDLNAWQMSYRACLVFLFTLILIRIAGRRSFGLRAPFDNIILILLGAILGRAVVGASPFLPTLVAGFVICLLHRLLALGGLLSPVIGNLIKGTKITLYQNATFMKHNLYRSLVSEDDVMEEVRLKALVDSLDKIEAVYMERNGEISAVKRSVSPHHIGPEPPARSL